MTGQIEQKDRASVEAAYKRVIDKPRNWLEDIEETVRVYIQAHDTMNYIIGNQALKRLRDLLDIKQP